MKLLFRYAQCVIVCFIALAGGAAVAAPPPNVVVTIKPIHSLVYSLMDGVAEPKLLIESGGSPHGYLLRPSEARMLHQANLVIWVGESLEAFMVRPIATFNERINVLGLADALPQSLLAARSGDGWDAHSHSHSHSHDAHNDAHYDPHLWLSPTVAKKVASEVAATLIQIDAERAAHYEVNLSALHARLDALIAEIQAQVQEVRTLPYLVFHDAYHYFEQEFGFAPIGSVQIDPERSPSARRISAVRKKIRETSARAVFSEPQFEPRLVQTIIEGSDVCTATLDPIGHDLTPGKDLYFILLRNLSSSLQTTLNSCSTGASHAIMDK